MGLARTMKIQQTRIFIVVIFMVTLVLCVGVYFSLIRTRELFPKVVSTVNQDALEKQGFKRINFNKHALFVPKTWVLVDKDLNVQGDILNGSSTYLSTSPNNLGRLHKTTCDLITQEAPARINREQIYADIALVSSSITSFGDYKGCLGEYTGLIEKKEYALFQFHIFRQNTIVTITFQHQKNIISDQAYKDVIVSSVVLEE